MSSVSEKDSFVEVRAEAADNGASSWGLNFQGRFETSPYGTLLTSALRY
jgi:hypothetical protein